MTVNSFLLQKWASFKLNESLWNAGTEIHHVKHSFKLFTGQGKIHTSGMWSKVKTQYVNFCDNFGHTIKVIMPFNKILVNKFCFAHQEIPLGHLKHGVLPFKVRSSVVGSVAQPCDKRGWHLQELRWKELTETHQSFISQCSSRSVRISITTLRIPMRNEVIKLVSHANQSRNFFLGIFFK